MKKIKRCLVKGCNRKHYAKGYCCKHWFRLWKNGTLERKYMDNKNKICKVFGCNKDAIRKRFCAKHYARWRKHGDANIVKKAHPIGKKNVNWKNGIAEYPNHYTMKKNRLIILMRNPKCEMCKKPAVLIHHKDDSNDNHKLENLQALCAKCHSKVHSKIYKLYGMTLPEIVNKFGRSKNKYYRMHQRGELKEFLNIS